MWWIKMETKNIEKELSCPRCNSKNIRKNGVIIMSGKKKKQRYQCKDCGFSFTIINEDYE